MGRQGVEDWRLGGYHHPGWPAGGAGRRVLGYGRTFAARLPQQLLPRPQQLQQPRAGIEHLPLLCRYGDGRYPCERCGQSLAQLPEGRVHRFVRDGAHLCSGYLLVGHHHPEGRYQPHAEPACGLRPLLCLYPCLVAVARDCRGPCLRRAGRCAHLGVGSLEGYLCRRPCGLLASLLPEDQQAGCAAQHPAHPGRYSHPLGTAVRGDAFGAELLPDTLAADRAALPHHVPADVCRRHLSALQHEESQPSFPHRFEGQRSDVDCGWCRLPRFALSLYPQLHSSRSDCRGQQDHVVCRARHRMCGGGSCSAHHLCYAQTLVERC